MQSGGRKGLGNQEATAGQPIRQDGARGPSRDVAPGGASEQSAGDGIPGQSAGTSMNAVLVSLPCESQFTILKLPFKIPDAHGGTLTLILLVD